MGCKPHSGASSQRCRSVDADAWCKWALRIHLYWSESESDVAPDRFIENAIECLR